MVKIIFLLFFIIFKIIYLERKKGQLFLDLLKDLINK
jgi:hypothetical protein